MVRDAGALTAGDVDGIVRYLDDPLDTTILVFVAGGGTMPPALTKKLKEIKAQERAPESEKTDKVLIAAAHAAGVLLTADAARLITSHLGDDAGRVAALVDVLAAASDPGVNLGVDDVRPYLGEAGAVPSYQLTNAIEEGDPATALEILHRLLTVSSRQQPKPMHPLQVMGMLNGYYRRILRLDDPSLRSPADAVAALGGKVKEYPARKALGQARALGQRRHPSGLRRAVPGRPRPQGRTRHPGAGGDGSAGRAAGPPLRENRRSSPMSVRVRNLLMEQLGALRHEPIDKRIRAALGDHTVVDSTRAVLVWEPKRIVPTYAVPDGDIDGELVAAPPAAVDQPEGVAAMGAPQLGDRPVYDPSIPFSVHTADGDALVVRVAGADRERRRVPRRRPRPRGLRAPRLRRLRRVVRGGRAERGASARPVPPRRHRPQLAPGAGGGRRHGGRGEHVARTCCSSLRCRCATTSRSTTCTPTCSSRATCVTYCAYKGEATYFSLGDETDLAWGYRNPLRDASEVTGRIAFFNERADIFVDGERQERPITPWSRRRDQG